MYMRVPSIRKMHSRNLEAVKQAGLVLAFLVALCGHWTVAPQHGVLCFELPAKRTEANRATQEAHSPSSYGQNFVGLHGGFMPSAHWFDEQRGRRSQNTFAKPSELLTPSVYALEGTPISTSYPFPDSTEHFQHPSHLEEAGDILRRGVQETYLLHHHINRESSVVAPDEAPPIVEKGDYGHSKRQALESSLFGYHPDNPSKRVNVDPSPQPGHYSLEGALDDYYQTGDRLPSAPVYQRGRGGGRKRSEDYYSDWLDSFKDSMSQIHSNSGLGTAVDRHHRPLQEPAPSIAPEDWSVISSELFVNESLADSHSAHGTQRRLSSYGGVGKVRNKNIPSGSIRDYYSDEYETESSGENLEYVQQDWWNNPEVEQGPAFNQKQEGSSKIVEDGPTGTTSDQGRRLFLFTPPNEQGPVMLDHTPMQDLPPGDYEILGLYEDSQNGGNHGVSGGERRYPEQGMEDISSDLHFESGIRKVALPQQELVDQTRDEYPGPSHLGNKAKFEHFADRTKTHSDPMPTRQANLPTSQSLSKYEINDHKRFHQNAESYGLSVSSESPNLPPPRSTGAYYQGNHQISTLSPALATFPSPKYTESYPGENGHRYFKQKNYQDTTWRIRPASSTMDSRKTVGIYVTPLPEASGQLGTTPGLLAAPALKAGQPSSKGHSFSRGGPPRHPTAVDRNDQEAVDPLEALYQIAGQKSLGVPAGSRLPRSRLQSVADPRPDSSSRSSNQNSFKCPADGHYGDEDDCTKFYRCAHGTAIPDFCPAGLFWSSDKEQCDWPESSGCKFDLDQAKRQKSLDSSPVFLYLTFDDGPNEGTPEVLRSLEVVGVPATFFINSVRMVEEDPKKPGQAERNAEALLELLDTGHHTLGDHSYDHMDHNSLNSPNNAYRDIRTDLQYFGQVNINPVLDLMWDNGRRDMEQLVRINSTMTQLVRMPYTNAWRLGNLHQDCYPCTVPGSSGQNGIEISDELAGQGRGVIGWDDEWPTDWSTNRLKISGTQMFMRLNHRHTMSPRKIVLLMHDVAFRQGPSSTPTVGGEDHDHLKTFLKLAKESGYVFSTLDKYQTDSIEERARKNDDVPSA